MSISPRIRLAAILTVVPVVVALYSVELLLTYPRFLTDSHFMAANPAMFDPIAATKRARERGTLAYPVTTDALYSLTKASMGNQWHFYPLAAKSHSTIVLCNESGDDLLIQSDRYGFSNPDSVWDDKPVVALIGDSFTQGECVGPRADIASHLRTSLVTLNAGISGSGPIRELGILREYVAPLRPPSVFWLFFEGNDIEDVAAEIPTAASSYLDPLYSQGLSARQKDIDIAIDYTVFDAVRLRFDDELHPSPVDFVLIRRLRRLLLPKHHDPPQPARDFATLDSVLVLAKSAVDSWHGTLTLIYLPDRRRFAPGEHTTIGAGYNLDTIHGRVLAASKRLGVPVIDGSELFARHPDPLRFWTTVRSHYDSAGYALVASAILSSVPRGNNPPKIQ